MKKILTPILLFTLISSSLCSQVSLGPFTFYPNNTSASIIAEIKFGESNLTSEDLIAAFDSNGKCVGASSLIAAENGKMFCNLAIYGDEFHTTESDEGMNESELFSLKLFLESSNEEIEYIENDEVIQFTGWKDLHGAPLDNFKYSDNQVLDFQDDGTGILNFNVNNDINILNIAPVPANNFINISFNSKEYQQVDFEVFDVSGKSIISQKTKAIVGENKLSLDLNQFVSGTYFIKIYSNEQGLTVGKFVKN